VDRLEAARADHPSVEINRQGERGAARLDQADARSDATTVMGAGATNVSIEDQRIIAEVLQALQSDPDIGSMKVEVRSDDGMVSLRGRVPDALARDKAGDIARNVGGVKSVDNMLTLG
jgi:osmotically-inducible protein OsmY